MAGQWVEFTRYNLRVETFHSRCSKWRLEGYHFVDDTPETPNISPVVVGFILPNLWTGVVRSACLRAEHALLGYFRYVQVAKLNDA